MKEVADEQQRQRQVLEEEQKKRLRLQQEREMQEKRAREEAEQLQERQRRQARAAEIFDEHIAAFVPRMCARCRRLAGGCESGKLRDSASKSRSRCEEAQALPGATASYARVA